MLVLDPIFNTCIPSVVEALTPFNVHVIFNGSSPSTTAQFCWTSWPAFTAFSPNVKADMDGETTEQNIRYFSNCLSLFQTDNSVTDTPTKNCQVVSVKEEVVVSL
jgi:hypothetical protein